MIIMRARNPGAWTAIGASAGTAAGTAIGNSPAGLALGALMGLAIALWAARSRPACGEPPRRSVAP